MMLITQMMIILQYKLRPNQKRYILNKQNVYSAVQLLWTYNKIMTVSQVQLVSFLFETTDSNQLNNRKWKREKERERERERDRERERKRERERDERRKKGTEKKPKCPKSVKIKTV